MGRSRLTREDLLYFRRRRKRQIKIIIASSASGLVIIGLIVLFVFRGIFFDNDGSIGGQLGTGTKADLGIGGYEVNTTTDATIAENDLNEDELDKTTNESQEISDIEFVVPETSLGPVEDIIGDNWYDEKYFAKSEISPVDMSYFDRTIFIGDSRTEGMLIYSGVPNINGFSYKGLSVDKLNSDASIIIPGKSKKYTCYQAISMTKYDNYYCMFGVNELGWVSPDVFIEEFGDLIDHIISVNPDAVIYVESILPVTAKSSTESDIYTQSRINEYNDMLLDLCKVKKCVIYLDIAASVIDDSGYLPGEASSDGVHCNADYCKRIIQYIRCNTFVKLSE